MFIRLLVGLLLLGFAHHASAQNTAPPKKFKSRSGTTFKQKGGPLLHGIFSVEGAQRYVFAKGTPGKSSLSKGAQAHGISSRFLLGGKLSFDQFDYKLNYMGSESVSFPKSAGTRSPVFVTALGENVVIVSAKDNPANKTVSLHIQPYDITKLAFTGREEPVASLSGTSLSALEPTAIDFAVSPDQQSLLIIYRINSLTGEKLGVTMLSRDLRTIYRKELTAPFPNGSYVLEKAVLTNDRQVFLKTVKNGAGNARFEVLHYSRGQGAFNVLGLDLPDLAKVNEMDLQPLSSNRVLVSGYYNNSGKADLTTGVFWAQIKPGVSKITNYELHPFGLDFLTLNKPESDHLWLKNKVENGEARIADYHMDQIIPLADGSCYVLGEERNYAPDVREHLIPGSKPEGAYTAKDILVSKLDAAGNLQWNHKVPKLQSTTGDDGLFLSYQPFTVKDTLYFMFNDDAKAVSSSKKGYVGFQKNERGIVVLAELTPDREVTRIKLSGYSRAETFFRPGFEYRISDKQRVVLTGNRDLALLKVFPVVTTRR